MKRILMTAATIMLMGSAINASTVNPDLEALITKDVMHYDCVMEEDLDAAFMLTGKGGVVPRTCLAEAPAAPDCDLIDPLVGHDVVGYECAGFKYRWFRQFDPDKVLFVEVRPLPPTNSVSPVPLPAGLVLLLSALGGLAVFKGKQS